MSDTAIQTKTVPKYRSILLNVLFFAAILGILELTGHYSFLLFHTTAEMFIAVVGFIIFMLAWNTRRYVDDGFFLVLGIGFFFAAFFTMLHALAYQGMPLFPDYWPDLGTRIWICKQYLLGATFVAATLFVGKKISARAVLAIFTIPAAAVLVSIFWFHTFPACRDEAGKLTLFKVGSEYIVATMFVVSMFLLYRRRSHFDKTVLSLLLGALAANIAGSLVFTIYTSTTGIANLTGHTLVIVAYYLIYKAILETGLARPFEVLFRGMKENERVLEKLVGDRTADLQQSNQQLEAEKTRLRTLASELNMAEERHRRKIATSLHDEFGQILTACKMNLGSLKKKAALEQFDEFKNVRTFLDEAIQYTRTLTSELSPPVLYTFDIATAIGWLGDQFQERHNLPVKVDDDGVKKPLSDEIRVVLFQSVRELLFNVVKHAQAKNAEVCLTRNNGTVTVHVKDDGVGLGDVLTVNAIKPKGYGLFNVKERIEFLGGSIVFANASPSGTVVTFTLPLS